MKNLFTVHYPLFLVKTLAFTLAETLIVMGIIGIVSALTLPNLNSSTGDKEKVAKVKKIYQNLTDALGRATAVYGPFENWFINDANDAAKSKRFAERMTEFMKVSKTCGTSTGCFSSSKFLVMEGEEWSSNRLSSLQGKNAQMYILADGTSIAFYTINNGSVISIDIDGPAKGKNQEGVDSFSFFITSHVNYELSACGCKPAGDSECAHSGAFDDTYDIAQWVIMNENMDYLKCASTLNWQTKTTCK